MTEHQCIYTVYKEGSFSAAAKKLFVSQPALSMTVKKVEDRLGIKIFNRSGTPLTLTEEGKVYIAAAEEIMHTEKTMKSKLSDMADLNSGSVIISGENFVSSFILPKVLMEFSRRYRGINVEIVESNSPDLKKLLLSEAIDLLVAHDFDEKLYSATELFEEDVLLAVPENSEINKKLNMYSLLAADISTEKFLLTKSVDLSAFKDESFILLKSGNDMCKRAERLCSEAGFTPLTRIRADQLITSYNLASAGMGCAFVSDALIKKAPMPGCVYYRLESAFSHRKMHIGYKKSRYLNRAAAAFIQTAKDVYNIPSAD